MNIECIICKALLTSLDDVYNTPCGHIFHFLCISHWLGRSESCPHCRSKVSQLTINKVNFKFSKESSTDNCANLRNQVEDLEFKLQMRKIALNKYSDQVSNLSKGIDKQRQEILELEKKTESTIGLHLFPKNLIVLFLNDQNLMKAERNEIKKILKQVEIKNTKMCDKEIEYQVEIRNYLNQDIFSMIKGRKFLQEIINRKILKNQIDISKNMKESLLERLKVYDDEHTEEIKESVETKISEDKNCRRKSPRLHKASSFEPKSKRFKTN